MLKTIFPLLLIISGCANNTKVQECQTQKDLIPIEIKYEDGRNIEEELSQRENGDVKIWVAVKVPRQWHGSEIAEISLIDNDVKTMALPLDILNIPNADNKNWAFSYLWLSKEWLAGQYCLRAEYLGDPNDNSTYYAGYKRLAI
jgi:hypothetical protein